MIRSAPLSRCLLAAIACMVVASGRGGAQEYLVRSYTQAHGLPSANVKSIDQCPDGQVWIGTPGGLARHDGAAWHTVGTPDPLPWSDYLYVRCLADGQVVALAPHTRGLLAVFDGRAWQLHDGPEALAGAILAGLPGVAATLVGGRPHVLVAAGSAGAFQWDGQWRHLDSATGLPGGQVQGVVASAGVFWMATDRGLARLDGGGLDSSLNTLIPPAARELRGIALAPPTTPGQLSFWLAGATSLDRLEGGVWSSRARLPIPLAGKPGPLRLLPTGDDSVLVGNWRALFRVELTFGVAERLDLVSGLSTRAANDLLRDREVLVWIAGDRGLSRLISRRFATYRRMHGLLDDEVSAIAEASPGVLVLGHDVGLSVLTAGKIRTYPFPPPPTETLASHRVMDLDPDGRGGVWIAATDQGLGHLTAGGDLKWPFSASQLGPVATVRLTAGGLLVAGSQGLFRIAGAHAWPLLTHPAIAVRRLVRRADGSMLVLTTGKGMWRWHPRDGVRRLTPPAPGPTDNVSAAWEERPGTVWIGSRAGLQILTDGQISLPPAALRVKHPVYAIAADRAGNVWLGSDRGVTRWDGHAATTYTPADGLSGWESNRAALMVDHAGNLWLGSDSGVSRYQPEADQHASLPPLVTFETIEAHGRIWPAGQSFTLDHDVRELTFNWRAISFLDEDRLRFRTRLEGFKEAWSRDMPSGQRSIRYTNLPAGSYRLQLRAANAAGVWSAPVNSATVTVKPPFWRTWWFALLLVGGALAAGTIGVREAVRWRYARLLEGEVAARTSELRESEARYRRLFDDDAAARVLLDPRNRTVVDANRAAARLCGPSSNLAPGASITTLPLPGLDKLLATDPRRPTGDTLQGTMRSPEGDERIVEVWATPVVLDGKGLLLLTARDVTERRHLQEQRIRTDKLEALGLLAGGLAHDFNNILAAVLGNISLARRRLAREHPSLSFLEGAETAVHRAQRLTGQLLGFARGGAPMRHPAYLAPLLEESARFVMAGSPSALRVEIAGDLWPAEVDEGQLTQAVSNLVLNADQAMPGGGEITLRASNLTLVEGSRLPLPPGPYVRIAVTDHGPGIPADLHAKVFEPYFTTKPNGTGLGLTSVYAIVSRHGGHVQVEADGHPGVTVATYLPALPDGRIETPAPPGPPPRRGSGRILVMDDEGDLRRLYRDVLAELGYEVETVADGESAIRAYQEAQGAGRPFACVLMDLTIPGGMGGHEAIQRLRELDPAVRAVVASGYSTDQVLANYRQAGFAAALTKPFTIDELETTLDGVLNDSPVRA